MKENVTEYIIHDSYTTSANNRSAEMYIRETVELTDLQVLNSETLMEKALTLLS